MRKSREVIMHLIFIIAACTSIIAVILICGFLFAGGIPAIMEIGVFDFLFGTVWKPGNNLYGIAPMIIGSMYATAGAILLGVPVGLLTAIFMARFCPVRLYKIMKPGVELMAGIPSVIYGFFALVVVVPWVKDVFGGRGQSILAGSILLAFMILPTIINVAEANIRAVSDSYYEGGLALGASHERSVFFALLPGARSGILAGIVLGVGRAIGETMAVMMVIGNQPRITFNPLDGIRTLTTNIVMEMGYASGLHREALIATAVVLFIFILIINLSFSALKRRGK